MADASRNGRGDDDVFADKFFVCAMSKLVGSDVEVLTTNNERLCGILDTFNKQCSIVLKTVAEQEETADHSEPKITTVVIERKHLISVKGKFSNDPSRVFLDHAIASNVQQQQVNGLKEDDTNAYADLVPWQDDGDSASDEQTNLVLEENEPGWDSSNMISTFEKANPGKTSYLGMEQYTNVEVPDLSENEVREISQMVDQSVPIDDDYKEDETRTEEEKFAAVERCAHTTESGDECNKIRHEEKKELRSTYFPGHQNVYAAGVGGPSESGRRRERYNNTRSMNFSRRMVAASPNAGEREYSAYPESQSARSSPYLKMSSPQSTSYYPRRAGGRGSIRYPGRSKYRGHPSLPIEIPRIQTHFYPKKQSPASRYDIETYDRQGTDVISSRQRVPSSASDRATGRSSGFATSGIVQMEVASKRLESTTPTGGDTEQAAPKVDSSQDHPATEALPTPESAASDVVKHSQLNPMANAYFPKRQQSSTEAPDIEHTVNNAIPGPSILSPFAIGPLLQALPTGTAMTATPIAQFAPLEPLVRGYDPGMALAAAAAQFPRRDMQHLDGNRPRKAVVSVNMPLVENPFLVRPIFPRQSSEQDRKSRRFVLTSNETSTTIQVPSGGAVLENAEATSTSGEQPPQDPGEGVVMAGTFSPQPQASPKETTPVYTQLPAPATFTVMPPGQQPAIATPNPAIPYAPAYYLINPAALAGPGIFATQPALYQSTSIMPPYPFCGYPTAPFSFVPLAGPFPANALQGQEAMIEQTQRRPRLSSASGGRRYSESVVMGNRSSQANQQDGARPEPGQKPPAEGRRGDDSRRKQNPTQSDGDSRRFANRRRYDGGNAQSRHSDHPPDHQGRRGSSLQHYSQSRHEHFKRNR